MTILEDLTVLFCELAAQVENTIHTSTDRVLDKIEEVRQRMNEHYDNWRRWERRIRVYGLPINFSLIFLAFILGLGFHTGQPFAILGILIGILLIPIFFMWTPLVVILAAVSSLENKGRDAISKGKEWAEAYLRGIKAILTGELIAALILAVVPFWEKGNWGLISIALLSGIILALIGTRWGEKVVRVTVIVIFFGCCFIALFSKTGEAIKEGRGKVDNKMAGWVQNPTLPDISLSDLNPFGGEPTAQIAAQPVAASGYIKEVTTIIIQSRQMPDPNDNTIGYTGLIFNPGDKLKIITDKEVWFKPLLDEDCHIPPNKEVEIYFSTFCGFYLFTEEPCKADIIMYRCR